MKSFIGCFIGLVLCVSVGAESILEGRVRLDSGEPVADAQVRIFDLSDLRQAPLVRTQTDGTGYFALPLAALAGSVVPERFALGPNYPNPFNPSTVIPYQLAASSAVRLEVFNLLGQHLATLVDGERPAGFHTATWQATDGAGRAVGAGVYIYRMTVGAERQTGRMVLIDGQAGLASGGSASVWSGASGGGSAGEGSQVYGLLVSGSGLVPYVDSAFRVASGMAPVELVVSAGPYSAGKATDDDCALCGLLGASNDQPEEEDDETQEEEGTEADSTSSEGGPDLIVQAPSASAVVLTPGQAFTLQVTVHNQGDEQAAATMLHYYRSNNTTITASDTEVGTDEIDALDASATSAQSIELTASVGVERYYGACVASVRGESNTDNNCSSAVKITVSEQEGTEEDDETPDIVNLSSPPTWVFAGDVPEADRTALREEMEYVRTWFAAQYGVAATGFTVLVGADYKALSPVYPDVVGAALSGYYHPEAKYPYAWVTRTATGGAVVTLMYGTLSSEPLSTIKHHIAHEYFHVLQGQLASGFAQLPDGEIAWHNDVSFRGPNWLVEGLASYADYAYTPSRAERRPFLGDRYYPYHDLQWFYLNESVTIGDLAELGSYLDFKCTFSDNYSYPLSFAASVFLLEQAQADSYVNYWTLLGERPTWQQAFEEAFGVRVSDFYEAFDEWLPAQLPSSVQLKLQMRWPDMESLPQTWRFLYLDIENWGTWENSRPSNLSTGWTGLRGLPLQMTVTYDEGTVGTGYLSLWWSDDQCTKHLLGWYKDGELTSRREDATAVEFTGRSSTIDWNIPGHPDTLPRLEEGKRAGCQ